jgi:hypothetical protein
MDLMSAFNKADALFNELRNGSRGGKRSEGIHGDWEADFAKSKREIKIALLCF